MNARCKDCLPSSFVVVWLSALLLGACGDGSQQKLQNDSQGSVASTGENRAVAFTVQINSAPLFESQQEWSSGYAKAIGHGPGVVVGPGLDNPNVFAQRFSVKPNEKVKVIAKASSVDKSKAMGRIQINWDGADGKYISVSSNPFEVTPTEQTFEYSTVAPDRAATGTLYVVGNGPADVVRYTEMRLLGEPSRAKAN
jgi:hypothetical protein